MSYPLIVKPHQCPGCMDRLAAILRWFFERLAWFLVGMLAGCAVEMVRCGK